MSTIGYSDWAVDLANVGAIYPFQGSEVLLVILGVAFWIGWHIIQIRQENAEYEEDARVPHRDEKIRDSVEHY